MDVTTRTMPIEDIVIGDRHRKDLGDLDALAESIRDRGLLHVPVVTTGNELVCGYRRIAAARNLGWDRIDVRVIDPDDAMLAERDENEVRKDFTPSERVAIARAIEAGIGNRQGMRTDLKDQGELRHNCAEVEGDELRQEIAEVGNGELRQEIAEVESGVRTKEIAAKRAGFGNRETYRKAAEVVDKASPETVEAMDRGDISIAAAHRTIRPPKPAGKSRVNGTLVDDPPDVAKARAAGKISPDVVVEIDEPGDVEPEPEPEPDVESPNGTATDAEWFTTLPVWHQLGPGARVLFERDALAYRQVEEARGKFAHAARSVLASADRRGSLPTYLHRLRSFLKINHPRHWTRCPDPEHGGCGGKGVVDIVGTCTTCRGGGYRI